jgi:hypothetical protein
VVTGQPALNRNKVTRQPKSGGLKPPLFVFYYGMSTEEIIALETEEVLY